jgi:hypothetical protein
MKLIVRGYSVLAIVLLCAICVDYASAAGPGECRGSRQRKNHWVNGQPAGWITVSISCDGDCDVPAGFVMCKCILQVLTTDAAGNNLLACACGCWDNAEGTGTGTLLWREDSEGNLVCDDVLVADPVTSQPTGGGGCFGQCTGSEVCRARIDDNWWVVESPTESVNWQNVHCDCGA